MKEYRRQFNGSAAFQLGRCRGSAASSALAVLTGAVALAAFGCSGAQARGEAGVPLGQEHTSAGESEVRTERQETRTIASETDLPTVKTTSIKGNINRMEERHFRALGVPAGVSRSIVKDRDQHGAFRSVEDLRRVPGMSPTLFEEISGKLAAGPLN